MAPFSTGRIKGKAVVKQQAEVKSFGQNMAKIVEGIGFNPYGSWADDIVGDFDGLCGHSFSSFFCLGLVSDSGQSSVSKHGIVHR